MSGIFYGQDACDKISNQTSTNEKSGDSIFYHTYHKPELKPVGCIV